MRRALQLGTDETGGLIPEIITLEACSRTNAVAFPGSIKREPRKSRFPFPSSPHGDKYLHARKESRPRRNVGPPRPGTTQQRARNSRKVPRVFAIALRAILTSQLRGGTEAGVMCALSKNYVFLDFIEGFCFLHPSPGSILKKVRTRN